VYLKGKKKKRESSKVGIRKSYQIGKKNPESFTQEEERRDLK
jgi:hypothetical protein